MTAPIGKRSTSPAFQFYPKDFLSSSKVGRMSLTEIGAYAVLLMHCWLDNGLPTDARALASILRVKAVQFDRMWSGALHECFVERGGKLHNGRLDEERKKQADFRKQQTDRVNKRWERERNTKARNTTEYQAPNESGNTLQSAISNLQSPISKLKPTTIVARRNANAAYEGPRNLYVLHGQHQKFLGLLNGQLTEPELFAWYETVATEWAVGKRKSENTGPDMPKFWDARFAEQWPPAKSDPRLPSWAREGA